MRSNKFPGHAVPIIVIVSIVTKACPLSCTVNVGVASCVLADPKNVLRSLKSLLCRANYSNLGWNIKMMTLSTLSYSIIHYYITA